MNRVPGEPAVKDTVTFPYSSLPDALTLDDFKTFAQRRGIVDNGSHVVPAELTCPDHGPLELADWLVSGCCGSEGHDCVTMCAECWVLIRCAPCAMTWERDVVLYARNAPLSPPHLARYRGELMEGRVE